MTLRVDDRDTRIVAPPVAAGARGMDPISSTLSRDLVTDGLRHIFSSIAHACRAVTHQNVVFYTAKVSGSQRDHSYTLYFVMITI